MNERHRDSANRDTRPRPALLRVAATLPFFRALVCVLMLAHACATFGAEQEMIGLTRVDVLASLGKPQSTLRRGDTELLVYPNGVRVDLRGDEVVAFRGGEHAVIVANDGTRYTPGADGKVRRADGQPAATTTADEEVVASATPEPASANASTTDAVKLKDAAKPAGSAAASDDDPVPSDDSHMAKMRSELEKSVEDLEKPTEEPPPPLWVKIVSGVIGMVLHFIIVLVILRIALQMVGVPFFWPDLLKVCLLYLAVREGLRGISDLGGAFEFIALFKIDDAASMIALSILLFRFKIALSGLTALKVAFATKAATYVLMMGVGLALTFGMMGMK